MNPSKELTIKKIRQSKNTPEVEMLIDDELSKFSKNKVDKIAISLFIKEFQSELLDINAMDVSSPEWENIKNARLHLTSLKKSVFA